MEINNVYGRESRESSERYFRKIFVLWYLRVKIASQSTVFPFSFTRF